MSWKPLSTKKRLMWISVNPQMQSSFSVVSKVLLNRLAGYDILYLAQYYYGERKKERNYVIAPYFVGDHILHYANEFKPEIVVFFQSPSYLHKYASTIKILKEKSRIVLYVPIEGYPITLNVDPLFSSADLILVPSKYSQRCLKRQGYDSHVLYHGVDRQVFKPAPKPEQFTIGSITSHVWRKQVTRIIDAHRIVLKLGYKIRLLLIVSTYDMSSWMPNLKRYAKKVNPTTLFHEKAYLNLPISQTAIAALYNSMHCIVQPSSEAFGLTCLEGMTSGTVPIIILHGASPEIVGDCGIYAQIKDYLDLDIGKIALVDTEDLAEKIVWAYRNPEKLSKLAQKGIERGKMFSWETAITELETLLAE